MASIVGKFACWLKPVASKGINLNSIVRKSFVPRLNMFRSFSVTSSKYADYYYAESHEYVAVEGSEGKIGISDHAQDKLGDIVYVALPDVGAEFSKGDECGTVESVKAASEIIAPVSGTVTEKNKVVEDDPTLINKSWDKDGWLCKVTLANPDELKELMDEAAYKKYLEDEEE